MSEASLRQEVEKRGLTWVQQILVRYSIRAPRVPASAKREERSKGSKEGESSGTAGPRVYRLPDGSKAMGIGTPDEAKAARAMADSLGIRTILVEEIAS